MSLIGKSGQKQRNTNIIIIKIKKNCFAVFMKLMTNSKYVKETSIKSYC